MRMQWIVKDFISRVNGIGDNYYFVYFLELCGLINATSDSEQLSFHRCDIDYMMNGFHNGAIPAMEVCGWCGYSIFDTYICNNKSY